MKTVKIASIVFLLVINAFIASGCWNYREINNLAIVEGAAIDWDEELKQYIVTVEIVNPKPSSKMTKFEPMVVGDQGDTIFDAVREIITRTGKKLYWSHTKVFIISEKVARKGLIPVTDWASRDAETRSDMWILISRGIDAAKVFECDPLVHNTVSYQINDALRNEKSVARFVPMELWDFIDDLSCEGISPVLPVVEVISYEDKNITQILGSAVFKGDKLIGWLDEMETRNLLFIRNEIAGGVIAKTERTPEIPSNVTLELKNSNTRLEPYFSGDKLLIKADVKLAADIAEINGTVNVIDKERREKLKENFDDMLEKQVEQLVKKVQKQYDSDIFGFGEVFKRKKPDLWRKIQPEWSIMFREIDIKANVNLELTGSAVKSEPITKGD